MGVEGRVEELAVRRVHNTLGIGLRFQPIGPVVFTQDPVKNRTPPSSLSMVTRDSTQL